jgi:hypothetical protein
MEIGFRTGTAPVLTRFSAVVFILAVSLIPVVFLTMYTVYSRQLLYKYYIHASTVSSLSMYPVARDWLGTPAMVSATTNKTPTVVLNTHHLSPGTSRPCTPSLRSRTVVEHTIRTDAVGRRSNIHTGNVFCARVMVMDHSACVGIFGACVCGGIHLLVSSYCLIPFALFITGAD